MFVAVMHGRLLVHFDSVGFAFTCGGGKFVFGRLHSFDSVWKSEVCMRSYFGWGNWAAALSAVHSFVACS